MNKKRMLLLLAFAAGVAVAGYVGLRYAFRPEPGITVENFERLREGMNLARVEAILGGPANEEPHPFGGGWAHDWQGEDLHLLLVFTDTEPRRLWMGTAQRPDYSVVGTLTGDAEGLSFAARVRGWFGLND
jgi:hypothetical protein